jgi:hypothetical protein
MAEQAQPVEMNIMSEPVQRDRKDNALCTIWVKFADDEGVLKPADDLGVDAGRRALSILKREFVGKHYLPVGLRGFPIIMMDDEGQPVIELAPDRTRMTLRMVFPGDEMVLKDDMFVHDLHSAIQALHEL